MYQLYQDQAVAHLLYTPDTPVRGGFTNAKTQSAWLGILNQASARQLLEGKWAVIIDHVFDETSVWNKKSINLEICVV